MRKPKLRKKWMGVKVSFLLWLHGTFGDPTRPRAARLSVPLGEVKVYMALMAHNGESLDKAVRHFALRCLWETCQPYDTQMPTSLHLVASAALIKEMLYPFTVSVLWTILEATWDVRGSQPWPAEQTTVRLRHTIRSDSSIRISLSVVSCDFFYLLSCVGVYSFVSVWDPMWS